MVKFAQLAFAMGLRQISSRHKKSVFGIAWLFLAPFATLLVYVLVFGEILKVKWPQAPGAADDSLVTFGLLIFVGLSTFQFFAECFNKACVVISENPNLVTKVVFPLSALPLSSVIAAFLILLLNLVLAAFLMVVVGKPFSTSVFALAPIMLSMFIFSLGISFLFSSLGVYFRDLAQTVALAMTAMVFLLPVFFPSSAFPKRFQFLVDYNPIAFFIDATRNALVFGTAPTVSSVATNTAISLVTLVVGLSIFDGLKKGFADVI
jgi:lipopolysaccharide transport system permease protein